MSNDTYSDKIVKHISQSDYRPVKPRRLARAMDIPDDQYDQFRAALNKLRRDGHILLGSGSAVCLPEMSGRILGVYRANPKGFGFVIPEQATSHGDLFIPAGASMDAMSGDTVLAKIERTRKEGGKSLASGTIVQIVERGRSECVGTLERAGTTWMVRPDGKLMMAPVIVDDVQAKNARAGDKVLVQITSYPSWDKPARGVISENLGESGQPEVETLAIIRAHQLPDEFERNVLDNARTQIDRFHADIGHQLEQGLVPDNRQDLRQRTVITIDPVDARDYDDAIDITVLEDGFELGVHIADVSYFVPEGTKLDEEARDRGNSVYLPRHVIPMLPEVLSNGLCSLQEGQDRLAKSVYITYGPKGKIRNTRCCESVIRSSKRLTYEQATAIIEGNHGDFDREVVDQVLAAEKLARIIEKRRRRAGMLHLDLPEVELKFDDEGLLIDAEPADTSYSHTVIEMFMVEANDAVARLLDSLNLPFIRRIHPEPSEEATANLARYLRMLGHKIPVEPSRGDLQSLLATVRGKPESFAINLAVLKAFQKAEYSIESMGHFALASRHYCHFTSPIRRYPDLTVHRLLEAHLRGELEQYTGSGGKKGKQGKKGKKKDDGNYTYSVEMEGYADKAKGIASHCSRTERRAEDAENELKLFRVLELLKPRIGDVFDGVVSGVANFGVFVQLQRYLVDGLVRLADVSESHWKVEPEKGMATSRNGRFVIKMGQPMQVQIVAVDPAARRLDLAPAEPLDDDDESPAGNSGRKSTMGSSSRHESAKKNRKGRTSRSAVKTGNAGSTSKTKHRKRKNRPGKKQRTSKRK